MNYMCGCLDRNVHLLFVLAVRSRFLAQGLRVFANLLYASCCQVPAADEAELAPPPRPDAVRAAAIARPAASGSAAAAQPAASGAVAGAAIAAAAAALDDDDDDDGFQIPNEDTIR